MSGNCQLIVDKSRLKICKSSVGVLQHRTQGWSSLFSVITFTGMLNYHAKTENVRAGDDKGQHHQRMLIEAYREKT